MRGLGVIHLSTGLTITINYWKRRRTLPDDKKVGSTDARDLAISKRPPTYDSAGRLTVADTERSRGAYKGCFATRQGY
jgi:hypothetical protein